MVSVVGGKKQVEATLVLGVAVVTVLLLRRRRSPVRRAAIEIGRDRALLLVADVDRSGHRIARNVRSKTVWYVEDVEDLVRSLVAEAKDLGAVAELVYRRRFARGTSKLAYEATIDDEVRMLWRSATLAYCGARVAVGCLETAEGWRLAAVSFKKDKFSTTFFDGTHWSDKPTWIISKNVVVVADNDAFAAALRARENSLGLVPKKHLLRTTADKEPARQQLSLLYA